MKALSAHELLRFLIHQPSFRSVQARVLPLVSEVLLEDPKQAIRWFIQRTNEAITLCRLDGAPDAASLAELSEGRFAMVVAAHHDDIAVQLERFLEIDRIAIAALGGAIDAVTDVAERRILLSQRQMLEKAHHECVTRAADVLALSKGRREV